MTDSPLNDALGRNTTPECGAYKNVNVCYWYAGNLGYALAGEVAQVELQRVAEDAARSIAVGK